MKLNHNKISCIKLVHLLYLYIWCTVTLISNNIKCITLVFCMVTGDWSSTLPPISIPHTKLHSSSQTLFVCSISFNIFAATVHAGECVMSLNSRMTHYHFQVMFVATGNRLEGQTLYSVGLQHAAHSRISKFYIYNNLDGQICHCYFST